MFLFLWLFLLRTMLIVSADDGIIGYDCAHPNLNYSVLSLNHVEDCTMTINHLTTVEEEVQLVEVVDELTVPVINCRITISRSIFHCGMHSHSSAVKGGFMEYPYTILKKRCQSAIETGELCLFCGTRNALTFENLKTGMTYRRAHTFAGDVDEHGKCTGEYYNDEFGSWSGVVAVGYVEVSTSKVEGIINTKSATIQLPNRLICDSEDSTCIDAQHGEFYWDDIPKDICKSRNHVVLYEGPVSITFDETKGETKNSGILTLNTSLLLSVQLKQQYPLCNLVAYRTDHPKILVIKKSGLGFMFKKVKIPTQNLDLFSYMNSKFVYIERNNKANLESLYLNIKEQQCNLERSILEQRMTIASTNPDELAYLIGKGPGHSAIRSGEVIYITRCKPVFVKVRKSDRCFQELPITYKNESFFLSPKLKLIQKHGEEVGCSNIFPPMYHIDKTWYRVNRGLSEAIPPSVIKPEFELTWKYQSIEGLAEKGIYSQEDLDDLRARIMHGADLRAVTGFTALTFTGYTADRQGLSPDNMFTEDTIDKVAGKVGQKIWGWFSTFGNISSGVIGFLMVAKLVKWITNSIINGKILYDVYGFSAYLLGCFMDALTTLFLHNKMKKQNNDPDLATIERTASYLKDQKKPSAPSEMVQLGMFYEEESRKLAREMSALNPK